MSKRTRTTRSSPKGVVLLLVLGIIMAITILSLGFIARCDTELASGQNMALRVRMDQLAASALEHGRGLLLNPQEVDGAFWAGDAALQLDPNTDDFYDVNVAADPNDFCTYEITSTAYRQKDGQRTAESRLEATLRLDPAIALWAGAPLTFRQGWSVTGDVYVDGALVNLGSVDGDVFSNGLDVSTGTITGRSSMTGELSLSWPNLSVAGFTSQAISPGVLSSDLGPHGPARVFFCNGNLVVAGDVTVSGMLLVDGDLVIQGDGVRLTAGKNLPAVYVTGNLVLRGATGLRIEGLVVVEGNVLVGRDCADVQIVGALFAAGEIVETTLDSTEHANDAMLRNILTWSASGALTLDGVNQYVQTPDDEARLQLTGEYTLSVRIKPAVVQKTWAAIVAKTEPSGESNHWVLQFDDSIARRLVVCHSSLKWNTGIELADVLDQWHQVAVVRQADGTMLSYLDGGLHKTLDPNIPAEWNFKNRAPGSGPGHLNIGADRTGSASFVYKGLLDDVRVYNRALTDVEVAAPPPDALIGQWTFDETSDSEVRVKADPIKAAIEISDGIDVQHWSPAAGAFFRSVRVPPGP